MKTILNIGITEITHKIVLGNIFYDDDKKVIINDSISTNVTRVFNLVNLASSTVGDIYILNPYVLIICLDDKGEICVLEYVYETKELSTIYNDDKDKIISQCHYMGNLFKDEKLQENYLNYLNTGKRIH